MKVFSGTAFAGVEVEAVFGAGAGGEAYSAVAGGVSVAIEGVYSTEVVVALEPAEAEADAEKEDTALAPDDPEEAFDWM